jgi:hypothetical protein
MNEINNTNEMSFNDKILTMVGNKVYSTNSECYYCERVCSDRALIRVESPKGITESFEVWVVRDNRYEKANQYRLRFPSNEDFGKYGWTYPNREIALANFGEHTNE